MSGGKHHGGVLFNIISIKRESGCSLGLFGVSDLPEKSIT